MVLIKNGIKGNKEKEWWQLVFDHFPQFPQGVKYSYDELTFREDVVSVHLEYLTPSLQTPNPEPQTLSTTFHTISPSLSLSLSLTHTLSLSFSLSHSFLQSLKLTPIAPMAAGLSASITPKPFRLFQHSHLLKPTTLFAPSVLRHSTIKKTRRKTCLTVYVILEDQKQSTQLENPKDEDSDGLTKFQIPSPRVAEKLARKRSERFTYLVAAVMSTFGITSMAVMAVYYRFYWQMEVLSLPLSLSKIMPLCILYLIVKIGFLFLV